MKKIFLVLTLEEEKSLEISNMGGIHTSNIALSWADGMVGVMPVFESEAAAMDAYPNRGIIEAKLNNTQETAG